MKNLIIYIILFIPFIIISVFYKYDPVYYESLIKPFFTLPNILFNLIWLANYLLITYSVHEIFKRNNLLRNLDYTYVLLFNYLSIFTFLLMFFNLKSPFFGFIMSIIVLISSVLLYRETKKIKQNVSFYLIPYLIMNVYSVILSGFVFFMNF